MSRAATKFYDLYDATRSDITPPAKADSEAVPVVFASALDFEVFVKKLVATGFEFVDTDALDEIFWHTDSLETVRIRQQGSGTLWGYLNFKGQAIRYDLFTQGPELGVGYW